MISCKLKGGLGNQMFQIAAAQALAWKIGHDTIFNDSNTPNQGNRALYYKDTVFNKIDFVTANLLGKVYLEPNFTYDKLPEKPLMLSGYYQSPKYFEYYRDEIIDMFVWKEKIEKLKVKFKSILTNSISVHIRRGDYVGNSNLKLLDGYYYHFAEKYFSESVGYDNILIFSDDMEWAKANFTKNAYYIEGLEDYEEMYLMSLCTHNIIANSSFSWWGAYLNVNPHKTVIAPEKWFTAESEFISKDIYTEKMILL